MYSLAADHKSEIVRVLVLTSDPKHCIPDSRLAPMENFNVSVVRYAWAATAHIPAINMPLTNFDEAAKTRTIIFAADRSARTGKPVRVKIL